MIRRIGRKTVFTLLRLVAFIGGAEAAGVVYRVVHAALRHQGALP